MPEPNPTPLHDKVARAAQRVAEAHERMHTAVRHHSHRHAVKRAERLAREYADDQVARGGQPPA